MSEKVVFFLQVVSSANYIIELLMVIEHVFKRSNKLYKSKKDQKRFIIVFVEIVGL